MKIARVQFQGQIRYAIVEGETLRFVDPDIFTAIRETGETAPLSGAKLLAPVVPGKLICVGFNYRDHAQEMNSPLPEEPNIFLKPDTTLQNPFDPVLLPPKEVSERVDYECELVAVIGKQAKGVSLADAPGYILGYTCGNDVSARDRQSPTNQWTVAKGCDTFMPLGPWIETEVDTSSLSIQTLVNGEVKQSSNTGNLIFDVPYLVHYLSRSITLNPGDIISTGTPSGIGPVKAGDVMEIVIQGIGTLTNPVR